MGRQIPQWCWEVRTADRGRSAGAQSWYFLRNEPNPGERPGKGPETDFGCATDVVVLLSDAVIIVRAFSIAIDPQTYALVIRLTLGANQRYG